MKKSILLIFTAFIIFSCQQEKKYEEGIVGKREELKDLQTQLRTAESRIAVLKTEINELDPPKEKMSVMVSAMDVKKEDFKRYTDIQAVVVSDDLVSASSELGGRIMQLHVKENQYVKKGQLIASMDGETIDRQTAEINKSLELAQIVYERQKRLWEKNIGSEIQYLEAKNNKERIEKSLETIGAQRSKTSVYSPISGVVDMEFLKQGEMASPGMPIVNILNTSQVKFVADVPEKYLSSVKKGQNVDIYIPALDKEMTKRVTQLGRSIDPANRTFKIEIATSNSGGVLKPNLLAEVKFNDLTIEDALTVPINLIQEEVGGKKFVYVVMNKDNKQWAKKTYVETSESNADYIVVTSGITDGEQLIVEGANTLTDMTPIKIEKQESTDE